MDYLSTAKNIDVRLNVSCTRTRTRTTRTRINTTTTSRCLQESWSRLTFDDRAVVTALTANRNIENGEAHMVGMSGVGMKAVARVAMVNLNI